MQKAIDGMSGAVAGVLNVWNHQLVSYSMHAVIDGFSDSLIGNFESVVCATAVVTLYSTGQRRSDHKLGGGAHDGGTVTEPPRHSGVLGQRMNFRRGEGSDDEKRYNATGLAPRFSLLAAAAIKRMYIQHTSSGGFCEIFPINEMLQPVNCARRNLCPR